MKNLFFKKIACKSKKVLIFNHTAYFYSYCFITENVFPILTDCYTIPRSPELTSKVKLKTNIFYFAF